MATEVDSGLYRNPNRDLYVNLGAHIKQRQAVTDQYAYPKQDWWWTGKPPLHGECPGVGKDGVITSLPLVNCGASRQELLDYFDNTWTLTEVLFSGLLGEDTFTRGPWHQLRHPLIFYYGHVACVYVNKCRVAGLLQTGVNDYMEQIMETGVDEMSWDDLSKNEMEWPALREVTEYRRTVYNLVKDVILNGEFPTPITMDSAGWAIVMGFEHERIHLETSSVLMRELPAYLLTRPTEFPKLHPSAFGAEPARAVKNAMVENAGGRVALGKPRDFPSFGWDNEYGARDVEVAPFKASKFLITNGEFLEFVCAGGYTDRASWTDAGWQWRVFRNVLFPTFWVPDGPVGLHQYKLRCIYEVVDLPLSWPVEVNAHEAQAFCRWRTALERPAEPYRLVTEGEHHCLRDAAGRAADPLTDPAGRDFVLAHAGSGAGNPHNANLRWSSASPVDALPASSSGCHDVMGNVWHWLEDDFNPLEGFEVHPMYMDFSTPCMDGLHTMIVGGSYISTGDEASVWSRFHFRPHFNQHSGFRIAAGPNRAVLLPKQGTNGASVAAAPAIPARTVDEHMLFHYGGRSDVCPYEELLGPAAAASFPTRVAKLLVDACAREGVALARALELGCAVGGASFALAERFESVVGVDRAPFVAAAEEMRVAGQRKFLRHEEGEAYSELVASCTKNVDRRRVTFHAGDPGALPAAETGALFDAVLLHTVLDRVADPAGCLARLAGPEGLVRPGGLLLIAHAGGWSDAHAPAAEWLGGYTDPNGRVVRSLEGISQRMPAGLRMLESCDLPKVVREDARHFRLEVVEVSLWRRDA